MIVSLNLSDEVVAYIDAKATECKQSRSAWMTAFLRNSQWIDSPAGKSDLAHCLLEVMAQGALRCGQSPDHVHKIFPQLEQPRALESSLPAPQLPAGTDAQSVSPPPAESVAVTRRRPYQRGGKRVAALTCPAD